MNFLPVNRRDMAARGWDACDFVFVSGDAYADHPAFAAALICRVLEAQGFRVGIIPQPDWEHPTSYQALGRPRLAFLVGAGNMDSMVAHYTAGKRKRSQDAYSPGGKAGLRPDRALIRYTGGVRSAYRGVPVIIGGIEASLRALAHYDYWSDTIRRSVLLDAKADLLVYGMGERPIREIAERLKRGEAIHSIRDVRGTCAAVSAAPDTALDAGALPEYARLRNRDPASSRALAEHFIIQQQNADPRSARPLVEQYDGNRRLIRNPPAFPLSGAELDQVYELPFTREAHPQYAAAGIPALQEVSFSLVSSRGCFGGCSFCAIAFHQGRAVSHRTRESLVREAGALAKRPDFKGYIHDVGGPTANFFSPPCDRQRGGSFCPDRNCLYPEPCPQLQADHREYLAALEAIRGVRGVKKVFIRSGIRYDYIALDRDLGAAFLETLCRHHVSGQLKVAPEHCSPRVLKAMGKGGFEGYERFCAQYAAANRRLGLRQYLVPYFMASHPASALEDAAALAQYLRRARFAPDQAQDFYPTPGTLSTVMYAAGIDPRTMEPVAVCRGAAERRLQRALLRFHKPQERAAALEALRKAGREDLVKLLR